MGNVFAPTAGGLSTGSPPPGGIRTTFIDCAALSSDATSEGVLVLLGSVPPLQSLVADIDDYEIGNCLTSFSRLARAMAWLWDVMDREETVVDNVSILSNCNSKALTDFCKALMADSVLNSGKFSVDASQAGGSSPSSNVHNIKRWRQLCLGNVFAPTAGGLSTGSPPPGGIKTTFIDCAALSSDATSEGVAMLNSGKFSVDASQAGGSSPSSNVHNIKRWRQLCLGNVFAPTTGGLSTGSPPPGGIKTTFIDCAALSSDATSEGVLVLLGSVPPLQSLVADIDDYEIGNCLTSFSRLARAMAWLWDVMDREETVVDNVSILSNCNSKALTDFCKALMADSVLNSGKFSVDASQAGGSSPSSNVHNIKRWRQLCLGNVFAPTAGGLSTGSPPPGVALLGAIVLLKVLVLLGSVPPLQSLVADIDDYEIGNCLTSFSRLARAMAWLWDVMDREETVVDNVSILSNCNSKALTDFCKALMADSVLNSGKFSVDASQAGGSSPSSNVHNIKRWRQLCLGNVFAPTTGGLSTGSPPPGGIKTTFIDCAALSSDATSEGVAMLNSGKFSVDASQAGGSSPSSNVHNIKRWQQLCLGNVFAPTAGGLSIGSPPPGGIKTTFIDCAALSSDATSEGVLVLLGSVPPLQSLVADIDDYEIGNCLTSFSRLARAMAWLWDVMDREETVVDNVSILSNCNSKALTDFCKALMADSVFKSVPMTPTTRTR
nr:hypothetical protein Iba_chr04aCG16380 [Ipomoea batatas]